MNIQTVADNLRITIAGKEQYLAAVRDEHARAVGIDRTVLHSTAAFLAINISELKRILEDVERCRPDWNVHNCPYTESCHRID